MDKPQKYYVIKWWGRFLIGRIEIRKLNTSYQKPERLIIPSSHSHSEKPKFITGRTAGAFPGLEQNGTLFYFIGL